ncbi:MAG: flagellar motor switch protein FliN [Planctomycetota bacterium]|jgi:flagellar motor switch protein FliN/FliY
MTDPQDDALDPAAGALPPVEPSAETPAAADAGATAEPGAAEATMADAVGPANFEFPSFDEGSPSRIAADLAMLDDVNLRVSVELGRTRMFVEDVLKLVPEAVIELDKAAGDPVDVFVNGRHVARGEVLVLNENFCVRINEIIPVSDEDD